jgi:S-adenosylmethionine:tRNA ribosyltransferase-isomerase
MYSLDDYDYALPVGLIAQAPASSREQSRLLVMDRSSGILEHRGFGDIGCYLRPGDVLVVNDTRVVPGRLCGTKDSGGRVELLVLDPYKDPGLAETEGYCCLIKASKRPQQGSVLTFTGGIRAQLLTPVQAGQGQVRFLAAEPIGEILERIGRVPLPPYIQRGPEDSTGEDRRAYQTVYAARPGAVAAPTAGLHFSRQLLQQLEAQSVQVAKITLHVGYGTFSPIRATDIRNHAMHSEYAEVTGATAATLEQARRDQRRIVAVGTTVVRILEWVARDTGIVAPFRGLCNHYIYPGYQFRIVQAMITNFHLPKSSLLLLVAAFAGREAILRAYREAIRQRYRFFSYGDAMLIV